MACAEAKHRIAEAIRIFFMGYPFRLNSGNAKLSRDCSNISLGSLRCTVQTDNNLFYFSCIPDHYGVWLPEILLLINKSGAVQTRQSRFFCEILREFLMNSKAIHKFAKSFPSRVKCRLRGCSSMVEQKLPEPLHLVKSHCSCGSEAHESAITPKLHLHQQVMCHYIFDPTTCRKSC